MTIDEIEEIGKDAIYQGKLSEYNQKQKNYYMYDFHHTRYIKGIEKYRSLKEQYDKRKTQ